ncbi:MAG: putative acyltransferase (DUF342 family) [Haloarculaceae archaeon]
MPSFRSDPLEELVIPDETTVEEHDLVTDGDVLVGGQTSVEFGVRGRNVIAGERVTFGGHIEAEEDCRLDMWCDVADNVLVGEDAYLGERVHVGGELKVAGDLDIGDDVDIEDGFEANGWIVIRNPMPTIVFLFVYLSQLLRIGEEEAAEEMLAAMIEEDTDGPDPVVIPRSARVNDDTWRVSTPARIGDRCRLHGNIRAESLVVGRETEIFGSLRGKDGVTVGSGTEVTGNVTTREGTVRIGPEADVRGDVSGEYVEVHQHAEVEGAIRAGEEMTIVSDSVLDDSVIEAVEAPGPSTASDSTASDSTASDSTASDEPSTGGQADEATDESEQATDESEQATDASEQTGTVD